MGGEFRTKGVNVFLGPVVSPLGRTVTSGRNWEGECSPDGHLSMLQLTDGDTESGIAPDPYLSGALVFETVTGVQAQGVITSTKVRIERAAFRTLTKLILTKRSTSSGTSRRDTGCRTEMCRLCLRTSTTRRCTNCTSGRLAAARN